MSRLGDWLKKKAAMLSLAMVKVEQNSIGQRGKELDSNVVQTQRHMQGTLMDSLKQGEVTQEVINLRWRTYKVLEAMDKIRTKFVTDDIGNVTYLGFERVDFKAALAKINIDDEDSYPLEMVVLNDPITISVSDALSEEESSVVFFSKKAERPIMADRLHIPKFAIESFASKMNVRVINDNERLLEFYISMYPDEDNRTTRLLISEIKKAIENPKSVNFLDLVEVGFISYKTIGVPDYLQYQYEILSFDKIITFNGSYVIKFIAKTIVNGESVIEQYRVEELDEKYENKEKREKK